MTRSLKRRRHSLNGQSNVKRLSCSRMGWIPLVKLQVVKQSRARSLLARLSTRSICRVWRSQVLKDNRAQHRCEDSRRRLAGDLSRLPVDQQCATRSLRSRSEEHTSELQSHSFISYAVFCLK